MASPLLAYSVIFLLLLGVAIYEYTKATTLSLPLSPASTISTIILPILSFLNTVYYAGRSRSAQSSPPRASQGQLLPPALQVVQTILTTMLGTTFFSKIIPSATQQCLLSTRWQQFWTSHDATTIRRIQDTFDCCGFNSVKDRAWPFPNKQNPEPGCAAHLGRTESCAGHWTQALQTTGGVEFGVVTAVGILQLINVLLVRYLSSRRRESRGSAGWFTSVIRRLTESEEEYQDRPHLNRPLLEDVTGFDRNEHYSGTSRNNLVDDEARADRGTNGYGGTQTGPRSARIEPSHLESSPWAGEEDSEA